METESIVAEHLQYYFHMDNKDRHAGKKNFLLENKQR